MGHACPHCQKDLPGFTTEATLKERVAAKQEEIDLQKAEVARLKPLAATTESMKAERDAALAKVTEIESATTRAATFRAIGIDVATDEGKKLEKTFLAIHRSEMTGLEGDKVLTFDAWVQAETGAKANPLLDRYFQAPKVGPDGKPIVQPGPGPGSKAGLIPPDKGTTQAPANGTQKMTPEQLREKMQAMSPPQLREFMEKHGGEYGFPAIGKKPEAAPS